MPEIRSSIPRTWVEFDDPEAENSRYRCDLTWLTSHWECIFGRGCPGIVRGRQADGCCTHGAHFSERADEKRVARWVERLTPETWQFHASGQRRGWVVEEDRSRKTRVVQGACILLNRPDFPGGAGCALHQLALREGVAYQQTKPDVCWQLPVRRTYERVKRGDGTTVLVTFISDYDRAAWGEGGHDLAWFCSAAAEAHQASRPVYVSEQETLIALMGQQAYGMLADYCRAHEQAVAASLAAKPPAERRRAGALLLIHPADAVTAHLPGPPAPDPR